MSNEQVAFLRVEYMLNHRSRMRRRPTVPLTALLGLERIT